MIAMEGFGHAFPQTFGPQRAKPGPDFGLLFAGLPIERGHLVRQMGIGKTGERIDLHHALFPALVMLDLTDRHFELVALVGDHRGIGDILLAQTRFQRLARRLIDPRPNFGIAPLRPVQCLLDGCLKSAQTRCPSFYIP